MKNFLRSTLRRDKMNVLALLCVESEFVENISLVEIFTYLNSSKKLNGLN